MDRKGQVAPRPWMVLATVLSCGGRLEPEHETGNRRRDKDRDGQTAGPQRCMLGLWKSGALVEVKDAETTRGGAGSKVGGPQQQDGGPIRCLNQAQSPQSLSSSGLGASSGSSSSKYRSSSSRATMSRLSKSGLSSTALQGDGAVRGSWPLSQSPSQGHPRMVKEPNDFRVPGKGLFSIANRARLTVSQRPGFDPVEMEVAPGLWVWPGR